MPIVIFLILVAALPTAMCAQSLRPGLYSGTLNGERVELELYEDGAFSFIQFDAYTYQHNRGTWTSSASKLALTFNLPFRYGLSTWEGGDEITPEHSLVVHIEDQRTGEPIPGASVRAANPDEPWGTITDIKGVARFDSTHAMPSGFLLVEFIGYASLRIPFSEIREAGSVIRVRLAGSSNGLEAIDFGEHARREPLPKQTVIFTMSDYFQHYQPLKLIWPGGEITFF